MLDDEALAARKEHAARRLERYKKIYSPSQEHGTSATIRWDQVPISAAEAKFKARAIAKGWKPHRPSWPDFLVETEGKIIAVEVKARSDELSTTQIKTFSLLEAAGVPVYVWKDEKTTRATLIRWADGSALKRLARQARANADRNANDDA